LAALLGAAIVGMNAVKMTAAEPPVLRDTTAAANPAGDGSKVAADPAQTITTETAAPEIRGAESGSETTSEPESAVLPEEQLSKEN
jgi:hypothetical protein